MPKKERRFRELVSISGEPEVATFWTPPEQDRAFMRAVKENRVLTIVPSSGKPRHYGIVGFHEQPQADYLIFPKPLPAQRQARVVGINYDLVRQPKPAGRFAQLTPRPGARARAKPKRAAKTFSVIIRRLALLESSITVHSRTKTDAVAKAVAAVRHEPFDLSKAVITSEVRSIQ